MKTIRQSIPSAVILTTLLCVTLLTSGCALEDLVKGEEPAIESVAPSYSASGTGEIDGFLAGVGSEKVQDSQGIRAVRNFSVRWGSPTRDSEFLLLPSTSLLVGGKDLSSATATDKAAAIMRLNLDGSTTRVTVSYEASSGAPISPSADPGYHYPVAVRINVDGTR